MTGVLDVMTFGRSSPFEYWCPDSISLMDGNAHDSKQLPVVLAGGGGGTIKGGQAYDLSADPNRKLCRLHLALMDRMGVRVERFGDAENALAI